MQIYINGKSLQACREITIDIIDETVQLSVL